MVAAAAEAIAPRAGPAGGIEILRAASCLRDVGTVRAGHSTHMLEGDGGVPRTGSVARRSHWRRG